jgi:hypothetical protein
MVQAAVYDTINVAMSLPPSCDCHRHCDLIVIMSMIMISWCREEEYTAIF